MLAKNLQFLRKQKGLSQQELADSFSIPRSTLGDYERGKTEPNVDTLIRFSQFFECSVDHLIKYKLYNDNLQWSESQAMKILAISVDSENQDNVELVDTKAEAGYLESFRDPEYIRDLPKIKLPNLADGTYRGFEIEGDSMLPMQSGSIVISRYLESYKDIKDNKTYIIVSREDGLVYKRVRKDLPNNQLVLISDNPTFLPYTIALQDIQEIWQYHAHLSFNDELSIEESHLSSKLTAIQSQVNDLHNKLI